MRSIRFLVSSIALSAVLVAGTGCGEARLKYPTAESALKLDRVVLYRNGVGYFERVGEVDGDILRVRVRKDQVNDLLKSLTVVERKGGKAVSVSMPLDPQSWANAALATLQPGRGNLAEVLDALRGTKVTLSTSDGSMTGRIVMVEEVVGEPNPALNGGGDVSGVVPISVAPTRDHRVTLLDGDQMRVVLLSKVRGVTLEDGDLAMQFNRTLDASAGEGMFQQVEVDIRLQGNTTHDLLVSYVVSAPMWKPTYRVVLPKDGKGKALLQGWAVVDNTSGEDWGNVSLGLTSGAPIAFRYDLHTPRDVNRADLTENGVERQAQAMIGETTFDEEKKEEPPPPPAAAPMADADSDGIPDALDRRAPMGGGAVKKAFAPGHAQGMASAAAKAPAPARPVSATRTAGGKFDKGGEGWAKDETQKQKIDFDALKRSTLAQAQSSTVSGLTRFDLENRVTVPQGTSTMVAVINAEVDGEETFLFRPGGAGPGFEANPYRVVRFKNATPFVLEPGPISIYSGGSFVGEGLSEAVGTNTSATIPFAVESGIMVTSTSKNEADEMRLVKMSRGVLEVESFGRRSTTYKVKAQTKDDGFTVLIRHPKAGWNYELSKRPDGTEDLPDAYLVKLAVPAHQREGSIEVVEQTPSRREISIWDQPALPLLEKLIVATDLTPETRTKLQPIIDLRRDIGKIDEKIDGLTRQRNVNDQRADEIRGQADSAKNVKGTEKIQADLAKELNEFLTEGNRIGKELADLEKQRLEKRIALEDKLQDLEILAPTPTKGTAQPGAPATTPQPAPAPAPPTGGAPAPAPAPPKPAVVQPKPAVLPKPPPPPAPKK